MSFAPFVRVNHHGQSILFYGYVGPSTPLKKFVGDYDNALMRMRV